MPAIRGVTVCVGPWYAALLRITLVRNLRHLVETVVITTPEDEETQEIVKSVPGAILSVTDAFTRPDANGVRPRFNKSLAIEESGFDILGRHGWIVVWDSDCLWPDSLPLDRLRPGHLHGARRRVLDDPARWHPGFDWGRCPPSRDGNSPIGFFQLFHGDDSALAGKRPWYDVSFAHAGGGDAAFMYHWPRSKHVMLPLEVLHLGKVDQNWFGTDPAGRDMMAAFVHRNGWRRAAANLDPTAVERVGEIVERVEVPGYPVSSFELPFVRRAAAERARQQAAHPDPVASSRASRIAPPPPRPATSAPPPPPGIAR
jgi:hypothetical protein